MSEETKGKYIEGDASVGKNVTTGGDATVRGKMQVDHDVNIKGTANIANMKQLVLQGHDITSIITSIFDGDINIDDNSLLTSAAILKLLEKEIARLADKYLRKDIDDEARGKITFKDGFVLGAATFKKAILSGALEKDFDNDSLISAKAVLDLIKKYLEEIVGKYIRKDIDDEARGLITFLAGLKSEGIATFLAGMAVEGLATFSGTLSSPDFWSGWTGKGWRLWFRDTVNIVGEVEPKASLELDDLTVRGTFRVFEFVINQLRGENDNYVFSGMMKVDHIDTELKIIYLDTNKGETYNPFRKDDILRCKRWKFGDNIAKQYDVLVKEAYVGDIEDGEERIDWIEYEKLAIELGEVEQGDVLCRIDNLTNPDRKGIITTTSIGEGAPYIDVLYGMMTEPKESLKVRLGRLEGIVSELFGELDGYGLYSNNAYLTGAFFLQTGEAVSTRVRMLENLFSSSISEVTYDINEEDNIIRNCSFSKNMESWEENEDEDVDIFFVDDEPIMLDDDMYIENRSSVSMENRDGREVLRIVNGGVRQLRDLFVGRMPEDSEVERYLLWDADVTDSEGNVLHHKGDVKKYEEDVVDESGNVVHYAGELMTEAVTIRPTLYISFRYMCLSSGELRIGFANGRETRYSEEYDKIVAVDELGELVELTLAEEGVWHERQYKGYWDKEGDFVIAVSGDVLIDNLSVTTKPLDDYKIEIGTELKQTSKAIGMYGRNINNVESSVTKLGVVVDAFKKDVNIFVNSTYPNKMKEIDNRITVNEEGISATAKTVEENVTRIGVLEVSSERISAYVTSTRTSTADIIYNSNVSVKTDSNGNTISALNYTITPTFLIANEQVEITSLVVGGGSGSGNPRLSISGKSVVVTCDQGALLTSARTLEAVASVTRNERQLDGTYSDMTYSRSMFITVSPAEKGIQGKTGETGAGEVYTLVDNGSYATLNASDHLTFVLKFIISRTVDGTSSSIDSSWYGTHKVQYKSDSSTFSNWSDIVLSSSSYAGTILSDVDFEVSSYKTTDLFMVRLVDTSSGGIMSSFTVPLKLQSGAAFTITENMIKSQVLDSDNWSMIKQTSDRVTTVVNNLRTKTGIDIESGRISISSVDSEGNPNGVFTVNTGNFKVKEDGTIEARNGVFSGVVTATGGTFDNCTINDTCTITKIEAVKGTIGGWKIASNKLSSNTANASIEVEIPYDNERSRFLRINSTADGTTLLAVRNDKGTAASFTGYGSGSVALKLNGQAGDGSYSLQSYGDVILTARASEHIAITGLTLSVKNIDTSQTLTSDCDVVTFSNTSAITVTMPNASANKGKLIFMKRVTGSGTITLSGYFYNPGNYDTSNTNTNVNDTKSMMFVSDGIRWIAFYCG